MRVLLLTLAVYLFVLPAQAKYSGGTGEPNDPYQIATAADLIALGNEPNDYDKHFILTADIDLDPNLPGRKVFDKAVIAPETVVCSDDYCVVDAPPFTGVFDGRGCTISHVTIRGKERLGLFGRLASGGEVKNLRAVDVNITGSAFDVGGLVGYNEGAVTCCCSTGQVSGANYVGGLVGHNEGPVTQCYSTGAVSGNNDVGGLVGYNDGAMTQCYSAGAVSGEDGVGGLVGVNWDVVTECYSAGAVSGEDGVGGLIGSNWGSVTQCNSTGSVSGERYVGGLVGSNSDTVTNCYSTGAVSGDSDVGGLVGYNGGPVTQCYSTGAVSGKGSTGGLVGSSWGDVTASFWDIQTSGQTKSAGGTGKTTAEMQTVGTFLDVGWDFVGPADGPADVWSEPEGGGYPILWWQLSQLPSLPAFSGGTGEPNDPYRISTAGQLNSIGQNPQLMESHFKLTNNVDWAGLHFYPIGGGDRAYAGVFDGDGHTVSHLTVQGKDYLGLFGLLAGEVKDLGVVDVNIVGSGSDVGGLVGRNDGGAVTQCYSTGVVNGEYYVGGLVGWNRGGTLTQCYSTVTVTADGNGVGGLVGENIYWGTVTASYSTGDVSGLSGVGGLVGRNWYAQVTGCYSTGAVSGTGWEVGGLVGYNEYGDVTRCYSTGAVSGVSGVGGLVGSGTPETVTVCFWDTQTSGQAASAGGTGLITSEMQKAATFFEWGTCGNEGIWTVDDGNDYPRLWWEKRAGKPIAFPKLSDLLLGTGSPDDPFLIYTAEQLYMIGLLPCEWDKHFKLMADIDLSAFDGRDGRPAFRIIAPGTEQETPYGPHPVGVPFTGVFDGNRHAIVNFTYASTDTTNVYIGLFGYVADAQIKDLEVIDPNVMQGSVPDETAGAAGCLVACLESGTISGCYVRGGNVKGVCSVGGLVGRNRGTVIGCFNGSAVCGKENVGGVVGSNEGSVTQCYSTGPVTGSSNVGGLVGENGWSTYCAGNIAGQSALGTVSMTGNGWREAGGLHPCAGPGAQRPMCPGRVTLCRSSGPVNGVQCVGGLVGLNGATLTDCYSSGPVNGGEDVGGLVGSNSDTVTNCYSTGAVSGGPNVGGLVGSGWPDYVTASLWDIETSGEGISAGGTGKTTAEMQTASTFLETGWDFVGETANGTEDIWWILEGKDYPHLWWEATTE